MTTVYRDELREAQLQRGVPKCNLGTRRRDEDEEE